MLLQAIFVLLPQLLLAAEPAARKLPSPTAQPAPAKAAVAVDGPTVGAIMRRPAPMNWKSLGRGLLARIPAYDPNANDPFQVDLRGYDVSGLDLRDAGASLQYADFDDRTAWPGANRLPPKFNIARIMDFGRDPGLGVRNLHRQGITGKGVSIAIIDQPLLVDHLEYAERLRLYEEIDIEPRETAAMHGPAVASIAVGKTVGVAPEADLYYIAAPAGMPETYVGQDTHKWNSYAKAVDRLLQINRQLPPARKIRAMSISAGWRSHQPGYQQITEAIARAKEAGMLIISASVCQTHGFEFHGLGRHPLSDPDDFHSYGPASWAWDSPGDYQDGQHLLVPMDARATASPTGESDYAFYGQGGPSWAIPYIAGVYALAVQVDPDITPQRFWTLALQTGRKVEHRTSKQWMTVWPILDPTRLIDTIGPSGVTRNARPEEPATRKPGNASLAVKSVDARVPQAAVGSRATTGNTGQTTRPVRAQASQSRPSQADQPGRRIDKLLGGSATRHDVIRLFGEPDSYLWGNRTYSRNDLPTTYIMRYAGESFSVVINQDRVSEVRFEQEPVYVFRDQIGIGSTLDEVLRVLGPAASILEGQANDWEDRVLYKDIDGKRGQHYYACKDQGVRMFFRHGKVCALYLLPRPAPAVAGRLKRPAAASASQSQPQVAAGSAANQTQANFVLGKRIPLTLKARAGQSAFWLRVLWVEFHRNDNGVEAMVHVVYPSGPKAQWRIAVHLLGGADQILMMAGKDVENDGTNSVPPKWQQADLVLPLGSAEHVSTATQFRIAVE